MMLPRLSLKELELGITGFQPHEDRPTATQHAAMLTIYNNKGAQLSELAKYLKAKGWITGDPTIYGSKGRVGIFESLVKLGLASKLGNSYELTEKGLKFIDPSAIIAGASNLGSDLHMAHEKDNRKAPRRQHACGGA